MAPNCGREIDQNIEALKITGFGDSQQAGRGQLAVGATVAEADFAPLHPRSERPFGAVVGGLDSFVFEESEQSLIMLEQSRGEIADLAVGTVQMALGQGENPFLDGDRTQQQLASINLAAAKLVPQPEQSGMLGQRVTAESLHGAALGELHHLCVDRTSCCFEIKSLSSLAIGSRVCVTACYKFSLTRLA